jgi:hypothetical protein
MSMVIFTSLLHDFFKISCFGFMCGWDNGGLHTNIINEYVLISVN